MFRPLEESTKRDHRVLANNINYLLKCFASRLLRYYMLNHKLIQKHCFSNRYQTRFFKHLNCEFSYLSDFWSQNERVSWTKIVEIFEKRMITSWREHIITAWDLRLDTSTTATEFQVISRLDLNGTVTRQDGIELHGKRVNRQLVTTSYCRFSMRWLDGEQVECR